MIWEVFASIIFSAFYSFRKNTKGSISSWYCLQSYFIPGMPHHPIILLSDCFCLSFFFRRCVLYCIYSCTDRSARFCHKGGYDHDHRYRRGLMQHLPHWKDPWTDTVRRWWKSTSAAPAPWKPPTLTHNLCLDKWAVPATPMSPSVPVWMWSSAAPVHLLTVLFPRIAILTSIALVPAVQRLDRGSEETGKRQ